MGQRSRFRTTKKAWNILPVQSRKGREAPASPTSQGLVGPSQLIADSFCVGCYGGFLTHPNTLREMTRHKDTRLRGCMCVHAFNSELSATGTTLSEQKDK